MLSNVSLSKAKKTKDYIYYYTTILLY